MFIFADVMTSNPPSVQALAMAQKAGDLDSCASTLVNLGSALMSTDPDAAIESLSQAVAIREAAVR